MPEIYMLLNPGKRQLKDARYIGQANSAKERYRSHYYDMTDSPKVHWISSLRVKNQKPQMVILEKCSEGLKLKRERYWIKRALSSGARLLNKAHVKERVSRRPYLLRLKRHRIRDLKNRLCP